MRKLLSRVSKLQMDSLAWGRGGWARQRPPPGHRAKAPCRCRLYLLDGMIQGQSWRDRPRFCRRQCLMNEKQYQYKPSVQRRKATTRRDSKTSAGCQILFRFGKPDTGWIFPHGGFPKAHCGSIIRTLVSVLKNDLMVKPEQGA